MLTVGVVDDDSSLIRALTEFWQGTFQVRTLDRSLATANELDVLVVDPKALGGHALRSLQDLRTSQPDLGLVLTYVYCDTTQSMEEELMGLADACVVKPYDLEKLGQTVRWVAGLQPGSRRARTG